MVWLWLYGGMVECGMMGWWFSCTVVVVQDGGMVVWWCSMVVRCMVKWWYCRVLVWSC
jgi:hypothetical protein